MLQSYPSAKITRKHPGDLPPSATRGGRGGRGTLTAVRRLDITRHVSPTEIAVIEELLDTAAQVDGRRPLSDHLAVDLANGGGGGFVALVQFDTSTVDTGTGTGTGTGTEQAIAYAQVSRGNDTHALELVIHPDHRRDIATIGAEVIGAALDVVASDGGGLVNWWVFDPSPAQQSLATGVGMQVGRTLHQMRRTLPTGLDVTIATRAFVPGIDEAAWLAVNNRAFAGHGEQGNWTPEMLRQRQREAWFDPEGFRILERDGRMAGFCWTKIHPPESPADGADGEIYVIAVDPDFHGSGFGEQLTLAGLEHLHGRGITSAMLYVDAANTAGVALYDKLGFHIAATTVAFQKTIEAAGGAAG